MQPSNDVGGAGVTGREALEAARHAGVLIRLDGNDLVLQAKAAPPSSVVELIARHKSELRALLQTSTVQWLDQNPEPSPPGRCAWCGLAENASAVVVPFGTEPGTHAWLHSECWPAWYQSRLK